MAAVKVSDVVVPEIFGPYAQQLTQEKARIIQSGVMVVDPLLSQMLVGGGSTYNIPSWLDLDASDSTGSENVATDDIADIQTASFENGTPTDTNRGDATPQKISTATEIAARLVRNQSWSSTGLSRELAGSDPMQAIAGRVAYYWTRRLQRIFVQSWNGIIADNLLAPNGADTHTQDDLINNISGGSFVDGVTNFSSEAFIDTAQLMGDSEMSLTVIMVHSVVYSRMQKNNLIDFIPDARGEINIPTFLGREVIVDDGMPRTSTVYDSWLFGPAAAQFGEALDDVPTEITREALAGNGAGQEILTTRRVYMVHPTGHAFVQAAIPNGGPSNANMAAAANWSRVYPERKQISFAVLRTREA